MYRKYIIYNNLIEYIILFFYIWLICRLCHRKIIKKCIVYYFMRFWYKTCFAIQFIRDKGNDLRSLLIAIVKLFIVRLDIKRGTTIVSFTTICTCVSIKSYTTAIKSFHLHSLLWCELLTKNISQIRSRNIKN